MSDLAPILNALSRATAQQPVSIEQLRKIADDNDIDVVDLYLLLDEPHIARKVGRISGIRDGKPVLTYWPLVELTPAAAPAPATQPRVHRIPPKSKPAETKPAAKPAKEPTMRKKPDNEALCTALLKFISDYPGSTGEALSQWAKKQLTGTERGNIKHALKTLNDRKAITTTGKTRSLRYFVAGANTAKGAPYPIEKTTPATAKKTAAAKPAAPARNPQIATASAELESATKAAQCADLLVSDMEALNRTSNGLVIELLSDLLPAAHQLKTKLARIARHIQQLNHQGEPA